MGRYVTTEMIEKARELDLYTYMARYEPDNLVRVCTDTYRLREHDSCVISNGLWVQKSTGVGGKTALDYLVRVRGIPFTDAVEQLCGTSAPVPPTMPNPVKREQREQRVFRLPPANRDNSRAVAYLKQRGISENVIRFFADRKLLYESAKYHNVVFVGMDFDGKTPRYAALRGCGSSFKGESSGSEKQFGFRLDGSGSTVHIFEAPIDLLSYASLLEMSGLAWQKTNLLSLGGVAPQKNGGLPIALEAWLQHRTTGKVVLHLDNDAPGQAAAESIRSALPSEILCVNAPVPSGKDVNDYLCQLTGIVPPAQEKSRPPGRKAPSPEL